MKKKKTDFLPNMISSEQSENEKFGPCSFVKIMCLKGKIFALPTIFLSLPQKFPFFPAYF